MVSDLRTRLANALKQHQFLHANHASIGSNARCLCGLRPQDQSEWADHVVADVLLSLPGIAIVELPEFNDGYGCFSGGGYPCSRDSDDQGGMVRTSMSANYLPPRTARAYAAALLAAASAAEQAPI